MHYVTGYGISFEFAKDRYNLEPSMVGAECIDWYNKRIFVGRIIED